MIALQPALCTRILLVDYLPIPTQTINDYKGKNYQDQTSTPYEADRKGLGSKSKSSTSTSSNFLHPRLFDNHSTFGLTKLQMFSLTQYHTIVYIDNDCLVVDDVSRYLIGLGKVYMECESLVAAAPDIFPRPDQFNSGVMVIRPNRHTYQNMLDQRSLLSTTDGGGCITDTGYLNAYFNEWYTKMPPEARLSIGYNAQQVLYDMSLDRNRMTQSTATKMKKVDDRSKDTIVIDDNKISTYWDMSIAHDLHIIHYSNPIKPWEKKKPQRNQQEQHRKSNIDGGGDNDDVEFSIRYPQMSLNGLDELWWSWYTKSKNYLTRYRKDEQKQRQQQQNLQQVASVETSVPTSDTVSEVDLDPNDPKTVHKLIVRRFKELRLQGTDTKEAMEQARDELQPNGRGQDPGSEVAAMFGL